MKAFDLPDIATCEECIEELFDPKDRRYRYPFTNCTNCGPRFTIVESLPYDRANTTMRTFAMCDACRAEYNDPSSRRFRAQLNTCPECGPQLELWDERGRILAEHHNALLAAAQLIQAGGVVAFKSIGGFQLLADGSNQNAVARLRERKQRAEKPLALIVPGMEWVRELCLTGPLEERALQSPEAPIVLLRRCAQTSPFIAPAVAPNTHYLGLMLPHTPLHHLLMTEMDRPVVATSGNRSGNPICKDERAALEELADTVDAFLVHDLPICCRAEDSIVRILLGQEQVLRKARGYASSPLSTHGAEGCHNRSLGIAWDGSGGEFILARNGKFTRVAHLRMFPAPNADIGSRGPRHAAAAILFEVLGEQGRRKGVRHAQTQTSSAGRLFDAIASITGVRQETRFEGQAAMELEFAIDTPVDEAYPFTIQDGKPLVVDWEPMVRRVLDDLYDGVKTGIIAARFHNTMAEMIVSVAERVGEPRVLLAGDCFQNRYLTERTMLRLQETGFQGYWQVTASEFMEDAWVSKARAS